MGDAATPPPASPAPQSSYADRAEAAGAPAPVVQQIRNAESGWARKIGEGAAAIGTGTACGLAIAGAIASGGAISPATYAICGGALASATLFLSDVAGDIEDAAHWVASLFEDEIDTRPWKVKYPPPAGWPDETAVAQAEEVFESGQAEGAFSRALPSPFLTVTLPSGGKVIWQGAGPGQITSGYAPVLNVPYGTTMSYLIQRLSPTQGRVFRETWSGGVWVWIGDFVARPYVAPVTARTSTGGGLVQGAAFAAIAWKVGGLIGEAMRK